MIERPVIGITMGDPAGIGPEITIKALSSSRIYDRCCPLVVGDASVLERARIAAGYPRMGIHSVSTVQEAVFTPGIIDVLDLKKVDADRLQVGRISEMAGDAAFCYVKKVIGLAMDGQVDATVTNALNKEAMNLAGHHYSGHTEIFAELTGTQHYTMMLVHHNLRVVHVSTHVSLREACDLVRKDRILEVIRIADQALKSMGIERPLIGVAGLNPHCGEGGLFGREELEEIGPAVEAAIAEGIRTEGPIPADSIFSRARGGWYDCVIAMYHDQGHIPLKVVGFVYNGQEKQWEAVEGVNVTLGLPVIRTSVDHGTAFDQAGKGTASEKSLVNAIDYAVGFARTKRQS